MTDVVDSVTRSKIMSRIRGTNTQPEMLVRKYLHSCGYRFRLHRKDLPGRPDLVLPKHNLVIFVHGCFWHRHPNCFYATMPSSRVDFWLEKFSKNVTRDLIQIEKLVEMGWRVLVVWECGVRVVKGDLSMIIELIDSQQRIMQWPSEPVRKLI